MKTRFLKFVWLPMAACFLPQFLFAQGALTPPGAPAPAMKTLAQIEPRTPISSAPFTITNPGSYYLTTNLFGTPANNGITVSSGNVVLDLEGFALSGVTGGNYGVYVNSTCTNVTVRNGTLRGWLSAGASSAGRGVLYECLHACANGGYGLHLGGGGVMRDCSAVSNASSGIYVVDGAVSGCAVAGNVYGISAYSSAVVNCQAQLNKYNGIVASYSTVDNCQAEYNGTDGVNASSSALRGCLSFNNTYNGFYASYSTVRDCQASYNSLDGVYAIYGSTVSGCTLAYNVQSGIYVYLPGCQIIQNNCYNNNTSASTSHAGIYIDDGNNRVDENHVTASGYAGIVVASGYNGNVIIRNTVTGNGANNYVVSASSVVGPLITTTGTITNANPWANFSF